MLGQSDYYPYEYVRSAGFIQRRFNVVKRELEEEGGMRTVYEYEYELLPDDGTVAEELITSPTPSFTDQVAYDMFREERSQWVI